MLPESILSNKRECFICKTPNNLHRHHIYYGVGMRKLSDEYGCWVFLCGHHHNLSDKGVHFDKNLDLFIKKLCQAEFEKKAGSHDEFIQIFGRNYL